MMLLFLALLSAVGQGFFHVRALKQFAAEIYDPLSCFDEPLSEYEYPDTEHSNGQQQNLSMHVSHSASARARRQGPGVLSNSEESAKT
jgi:hypothetical protein